MCDKLTKYECVLFASASVIVVTAVFPELFAYEKWDALYYCDVYFLYYEERYNDNADDIVLGEILFANVKDDVSLLLT